MVGMFEGLLRPQDWMAYAACKETFPDAFYPEKGDPAKLAKKTCARCDVREQCLQYALDNDERLGIWGGLGSKERSRIQRGLPAKKEHRRENGHGYNCHCPFCRAGVAA